MTRITSHSPSYVTLTTENYTREFFCSGEGKYVFEDASHCRYQVCKGLWHSGRTLELPKGMTLIALIRREWRKHRRDMARL